MITPNSQGPFQLQTLKAAKVSEISETTASINIPDNEKINFHIGNPLQEDSLDDLYFSLCTGLPKSVLDERSSELEDPADINKLSFIYRAIKNSVPYMPRGGYSVKNVPEIIKKIQDWLNNQEESLIYSFGTNSDKECILSTGGKYEFVRILFGALSRFSVSLPVQLITYNFEIPFYLKEVEGIESVLDFSGSIPKTVLDETLSKAANKPILLLIGKQPGEKERRSLRKAAEKSQVLFVELFDAANHKSLARESGLKDSVIRYLTEAVFDLDISPNATQFVLGNSTILKLIESVHFELKGTPSSTEKDLLEYSLNQVKEAPKASGVNTANPQKRDTPFQEGFSKNVNAYFQKTENRINSFSTTVEKYSASLLTKSQKKLVRYNNRRPTNLQNDESEFKSASGLLSEMLSGNLPDIEKAFLGQFIKHNPQYDFENCFAVSGSSRTALSLLGRHCGINEIVTFDWSWSYENCFNKVSTVPLFTNGTLNSDDLINEVLNKIKKDPQWKNRGAVVLNNPHNASGRILDEPAISRLLITLLDHNILVIDDLCYQDVAPTRNEIKIKTLKELALEANQKGLLSSEKLKYLITTHALSKTDCFAGARLTVVEIELAQLRHTFSEINNHILPNNMALFLAYLFYRNDHEAVKHFWNYRNTLFAERAEGIKSAFDEFPAERNTFDISVKLPTGSMYPHLLINKFPKGVSTDNISLKLAQRGIGLIPLTAFSKTAEGYSTARNAFRLSLGGKDNAEILKNKSRRLIIEMNRLLNEESRDYQILKHTPVPQETILPIFETAAHKWQLFLAEIEKAAQDGFRKKAINLGTTEQDKNFAQSFLPWRLSILNTRFNDCLNLNSKLLRQIQSQKSDAIARQLKKELLKDELANRQKQFKQRMFDRTVHPTQMYSLKVDVLLNSVFEALFFDLAKNDVSSKKIADEIIDEYFGINIPINSEQEAYELIYDLKALVQTELYSEPKDKPLLSFWGDWDGSTRPSGQGHRLVAAVLLENVKQMARFLETLHKYDPTINIDAKLVSKIKNLQKGIDTFWDLLNKITRLTNQFEKKYKGLLSRNLQSSRSRRLAVKLKLRRDPLSVLFSHNSRLEKTMLQLRQQRTSSLQFYFELNKQLRKKLYSLIPKITEHINIPQIALLASSYRNLLSRFALTPRIHQKTITSKDPFTIENTVHNLLEINQIGDRFGSPGLVMALQISMSSKAKALIELNRLIAGKTELLNRENPDQDIKGFWLIPLFEDENSINNLKNYLDEVWAFAEQSRSIKQPVSNRFEQILCEIFVAGSDLSQQVGQPKSWELFKETKFFFYKWLAQKGMIENVRVKLGCGEPMQRQGGYYTPLSGKPVLYHPIELDNISKNLVKPAAKKSIQYASSPLRGLHSGGELRTIQSNAAEHIFRFLNFEERSQLFYHISQSQKLHSNDLLRVGKLFQNTRLNLEEKGNNELRRINHLSDNAILKEFLEKNKENFRQIVYGKDEDIVGIHAVTYFISQMVPTLRDRPTVRPTRETSQLAGQKIVERIAHTLPLAHHGSLLRAIGHNHAQSMILGINQLSTGLFRSLKLLSDKYDIPKITPLLSALPVMEILHGLRIYQQDGLKYMKQIAPAFKTGNSALHALDEDFEYMKEFIPLLQKELIARQGLTPADFFDKNVFKKDLLPLLRPDLAVLLQENLFNTRIESLTASLSTSPSEEWRKEMTDLLELPEQIKKWRAKTWELIGTNILNQVSSFVDLAKALTTLASNVSQNDHSIDMGQSRSNRLINQVNTVLSGASDDSMRQFLHSVVEYISRLPQDSAQLPIDTMRVLHDIERIIKIDEQLLTRKEQSKLRFYILQMARLAGENG
jgi:aspartate/methionine/tyrosine aminotransferase